MIKKLLNIIPSSDYGSNNSKSFNKESKMRFTNNIGFILLAIYLILVGITMLFTGFAIPAVLLGVLALAAGIFILIGR